MKASSQNSAEAWRALLLAYDSAMRAVEAEVLRDAPIPLTWYDVLLELRGASSGLRMQDLADRVVLSRTRVSRLVDEMTRQGLLVKRADPDDRRGTWAMITDAGRGSLDATAPVYMAAVEEHFGRFLSPSESDQLRQLLLKVARGLGRWRDAES